MRKLTTFLFAMTLLAPAQGALASDGDPVVVELFTSQACPACPAAEAYLRELAGRDDVVALEYHIDYYDYSGWKDPFGKPDFTQRWHAYARALGARYEYTPLMVVGGAAHAVGSERGDVERRIRQQRTKEAKHPQIRLAIVDGAVVVTIDGAGPAGKFDVLAATYDRRHETTVTAGENRGKTLVNANVVREFRRIAQWSGAPVTVRMPLDPAAGDGGCAVLLQRAGGGPVLAAETVRF